MQDLAQLIAPRKLIVISDKFDEEHPVDKAINSFSKVKEIYAQYGAEDNCVQIIKEDENCYFDKEITWKAIKEAVKSLKW